MRVVSHAFDDAIQKVERLPEHDQDALAGILLSELEDEAKWQKKFARGTKALERMAEEARADHRSGKTQAMRLPRK